MTDYRVFGYFLLLSVYSIFPLAASDSEILNRLFTASNYDPWVRPPGANLSVAKDEVNENGGNVVTTNVYLRSIRRVDETNMDITVQITLRHVWVCCPLAQICLVGPFVPPCLSPIRPR